MASIIGVSAVPAVYLIGFPGITAAGTTSGEEQSGTAERQKVKANIVK